MIFQDDHVNHVQSVKDNFLAFIIVMRENRSDSEG